MGKGRGRQNRGKFCPFRMFGRFCPIRRFKNWRLRMSLERGIKITCECLKCGYTTTTNKHCVDLSCPKCGGSMRRKDRPGRGR